MTLSKRYYVEVEKRTNMDVAVACWIATVALCVLAVVAPYEYGLFIGILLGTMFSVGLQAFHEKELVSLPVSQGIKEEKVKG